MHKTRTPFGALPAAFAMLLAASPQVAQAFTVTTVHSFVGGSDANQPLGGLAATATYLWGTSCAGGTPGLGTIYRLRISNLAFYNQTYAFGPAAPPDGACPAADLRLRGGLFYGTTQRGGSSGNGTLFSISPSTSIYTLIYSFAGGSDGANPLSQ